MLRKKLAKECKELLRHLLRLLSCIETSSKLDESQLSCVVRLLQKVIQHLSRDDCQLVLKNGIVDMKEAIDELGSQFLRLTILVIRHEDDVSDFLSHLDKDLKLLLDLFDGNVLRTTNVAVQAGITLIEENCLAASVQSHVMCSLARVFQDYLPKVRQTSEVDQWYAVLLGSLWLKKTKRNARKKAKEIISQVLLMNTLCRVRVQGPNDEEDFKTLPAEVLIEMKLGEMKRLVPEALQSFDVECTAVGRRKWEKGSRRALEIIKAVLVTAVDTLSVITKPLQEKLKDGSIEMIGKQSEIPNKKSRNITAQRIVERINEKNVKVGDKSNKKVNHLIKHKYEMNARIEQVASNIKCSKGKHSKNKFARHNGETIHSSESKSREPVLKSKCPMALQIASGPNSQINPDSEWKKLKPDINLCGSLGKSLNDLRIKKNAHSDAPSPRSTTSFACEEEKNYGKVHFTSNMANDQLVCDKTSKNKLDPIGSSIENCEQEFFEPRQYSTRGTGSQDRPLGNKIVESMCVEVAKVTESSLDLELATFNEFQPADTQSQELYPNKKEIDSYEYVIPGSLDSVEWSNKTQQKKHPLHTKKHGITKFGRAPKTHLNSLILSLESDSDLECNYREATDYKKSEIVSLQMQGGSAVNLHPNENGHGGNINKCIDKQGTSNKAPKQLDTKNYASNMKKNIDKQGKCSRPLKHIDIDNDFIFPSFSEVKKDSNSKACVKGTYVESDVMKCMIKNQITEFARQTNSKRSLAQKDRKENRKVKMCSASEGRCGRASAKPTSACLPDSLVEQLELGKAVEDNDGIPKGWRRIVQPRVTKGRSRVASKVDVKIYIPGKKGYCKCPKDLKKYFLKEGGGLFKYSVNEIFKLSSLTRAKVTEIEKRLILSCHGDSSEAKVNYSNHKKTTSHEKIKNKINVFKQWKKNSGKYNEDDQFKKISREARSSGTRADKKLIVPADVGKEQRENLVLVEPQGKYEGETKGKLNMDADPAFHTDCIVPLGNTSCAIENSEKESVPEYDKCNYSERSLFGELVERSKESIEEELIGNMFMCKNPQFEDTHESGSLIRDNLNMKCKGNGNRKKISTSQERLNILNLDCKESRSQSCKRLKIKTSLPTADCTVALENASCVMENDQKECILECNKCDYFEKSLSGEMIEKSKEMIKEELTGTVFSDSKDTFEGNSVIGDILNMGCKENGEKRKVNTSQKKMNTLNEDCKGNRSQSCKRLKVETNPHIECTVPLENASCPMGNRQKECVVEYQKSNYSEKIFSGEVIERSKEMIKEEWIGNMLTTCKDSQIVDDRVIRDNLKIFNMECKGNGVEREVNTSQERVNVLNVDCGESRSKSCKRLKIETSSPTAECTVPLGNAFCAIESSQKEIIPEYDKYNSFVKSLSGGVIVKSKEMAKEEFTGNVLSKCQDSQVGDTHEGGSGIRDNLNILNMKCKGNGGKWKVNASQERLNALNVDCRGSRCQTCKLKIETSPLTTEKGCISPSPDRRSHTFKTIISETGVPFIPSDTQAARYSENENRSNVFEFVSELNVVGDRSKHDISRITSPGMLMADASSSILSADERKTSEEKVKIHEDKATSCSRVSCSCSRIGSNLNWKKDNIKCETDYRYGNSLIDFTPDYTPRIQRVKVSRDLLSGIHHALVPIPESARSGNVLVEVRYHRVFSASEIPQLLDSSCYVLPKAHVSEDSEYHRGCSRSLMNQFASSKGKNSGKPQQDKVRESTSDTLSKESFSLSLLPDTPESGNVVERNCHCLKSQKTKRKVQVTKDPSILVRNSNPLSGVNPVSAVNPVPAINTVLSAKPVEELVSKGKQSCSPLSQSKSRYCYSQVLETHRRFLRLVSVSQSSSQTHLCINHRTRRSSLKSLSWSYVDLLCPLCVMTLDGLTLCTYYIDIQQMIPVNDVVTSPQESNGKQAVQAEYEFYVNTIRRVFPSFNDLLSKDLPSKCVFHGIRRPDWRLYQNTLNLEFFNQSSLTMAGSVPGTPSAQDPIVGQATFESTFKRMDNVPGTRKASSSYTVSRHYLGTSNIVKFSEVDETASPSCSSENMFDPVDLKYLQIEKMEKVDQVQIPNLENQTKQKNRSNMSSQSELGVKKKKSSKKRQKNSGTDIKKLEFKNNLESES